ncbi:MAG: DUF1905 domain-containing protein [Pirellulales bacterium]
MEFRCTFSGKLWKYGGTSSWWFISLTVEDSEDIEKFCSDRKRNFGSISVTATVGKTCWQTSVFRDSKLNCYLLPVKSGVRRQEKLVEGSCVEVTIVVD